MLNLTIATGNDFICFWDFGDKSEEVNVTYEQFLDNHGAVVHQYEEPTIQGYDVKVNCYVF